MENSSKKCIYCREEIDEYALVCCHCGKQVIKKNEIEYFAYAISLPRYMWVFVTLLCLNVIIFIILGYWEYALISAIITFPFFWVANDGYKKYIKWDHTYLYSQYLEKKRKQLPLGYIFSFFAKAVFILIVLSFFTLIITKPDVDDFNFSQKSNKNSNDFVKIDFVVLSIYCSPTNNEHYFYIAILGNIYKFVNYDEPEKNIKECKKMQEKFLEIDITIQNKNVD